ncbi:Uncharacterised protein [Capnocytophaga ochracea]|uniref:Uncharacterized protein n=1 Tax=Capnocytophaga ochracea TaxID=1018 RepID=A0A7Z8YBD7_CAPOC|nr:Uncharacterised protein [Capnocytophaga ochracea]
MIKRNYIKSFDSFKTQITSKITNSNINIMFCIEIFTI